MSVRFCLSLRRHSIRLDPAKYVLIEKMPDGSLQPASLDLNFERTKPISFKGTANFQFFKIDFGIRILLLFIFLFKNIKVQTIDGEAWYDGTIHEIQTEKNLGIFGQSEDPEEQAYIYDENDPSDTGIPASKVRVKIENINLTLGLKAASTLTQAF